MFLELHLSESGKKVMVNIDRIKSIYEKYGTTNIYIGKTTYHIKESYDQIKELISNYILEESEGE